VQLIKNKQISEMHDRGAGSQILSMNNATQTTALGQGQDMATDQAHSQDFAETQAQEIVNWTRQSPGRQATKVAALSVF